MTRSSVHVVRRTGQVLTGIGALVVLIGLLGGAPILLLAFAGNPLPDHLPGIAELARTLTSRDDGQLFLRALALLGWAGWATFTLSVLVELPARAARRPAVRLPGLGRQQRAAAALVGSIALILVTSPAATAATAAVATAPHPPPMATSAIGSAMYSTQAPHWLAEPDPADEPTPVYRVEKDDYLGHIADRYLGDFNAYPKLARLNKIHNPDRIRPGQMLHLPPEATDHGFRAHALGLVAVPPPPDGWAEPAPAAPHPPTAVPVPPPSAPDTGFTVAVGASRAAKVDSLNRPLAITAVISLASIVGAQIGAALGLRRRPAPRRPTGGRGPDSGRHRSSG